MDQNQTKPVATQKQKITTIYLPREALVYMGQKTSLIEIGDYEIWFSNKFVRVTTKIKIGIAPDFEYKVTLANLVETPENSVILGKDIIAHMNKITK